MARVIKAPVSHFLHFIDLSSVKGGGGFRPIILENSILRYELKGQDTSRHL